MLRSGDTLIVKSLDRLSRNKSDIIFQIHENLPYLQDRFPASQDHSTMIRTMSIHPQPRQNNVFLLLQYPLWNHLPESLPYKSVHLRITRYGMTFEEAISKPFADKSQSLKHLCKERGVSYSDAYYHVKYCGWTVEKALNGVRP